MNGLPRRLLSGLAAAVVLAPCVARADAREVAARLAEQWRVAGAKVTELPTRFLFDDDRQVVPIPASEENADCTYVVLVAARGLSFRARLSDAPSDPLEPPEPSARGSSSAGVIALRRCASLDEGEEDVAPSRNLVRHVEVVSDAGRGAVEIVVARGPADLANVAALIPERTGGTLPPAPDAGSIPSITPPEQRLKAAEDMARREGAAIQPRLPLVAEEDGTGEVSLDLGEGCHRIEVASGLPSSQGRRRFRLDVDAELRDGGEMVARDRTEAPDARLETCLGRPSRLDLAYAGATPGGEVVVARASWPLPPRLPSLWGARAKGRMARVLFVRHVATPASDPVFLAEGSSGATPLALPVEVGGCYVTVVGVIHGRARQLQLRATVGARESVDERGATEGAAVSAFCVRAAERARVEILARPSTVAWGLALYRIRSGVWEPGP